MGKLILGRRALPWITQLVILEKWCVYALRSPRSSKVQLAPAWHPIFCQGYSDHTFGVLFPPSSRLCPLKAMGKRSL
jgi:hypothetical protein